MRETLTKSHETRQRPISCQIQTLQPWQFAKENDRQKAAGLSVCSVVGRRRPAFALSRFGEAGPRLRYRATPRQARLRAIALRRVRPALALSRYGEAGPPSR